jgi:hypothetical protein
MESNIITNKGDGHDEAEEDQKGTHFRVDLRWMCCDVSCDVCSVCAQEDYILDNEKIPRVRTINYTIDSVKVSLENWVHVIQNMGGK